MTQVRRILLVEDNPGDAHLVCESIEDSLEPSAVVVVRDGAKALAYLRGEAEYCDRLLPHLVLLDLNLPKIDGSGVLMSMRADPALRAIPVVVLTSSDARNDILRAYESGANGYVCKPTGLVAYQNAVAAIQTFWLRVARLPGEELC